MKKDIYQILNELANHPDMKISELAKDLLERLREIESNRKK